jgi:hypothetical protein
MDLLLFVHDHCNGGDDFGNPYVVEEDGRRFYGDDILWRVNGEYIKLIPSHTLNEEGIAVVDWDKVATAVGLSLFEANVLNLRCARGVTRQQLFDGAEEDEALRLRYQAAWRAIDRRQDQIQAILGARKPGSALPTGLQIAPPVRRTEIPMPERLAEDDDKILQDIERRFAIRGAKKGLEWGQDLRSGRRF